MTSVHTHAVVGPDGARDLHVSNLPAGQQVSVTIEVPDVPSAARKSKLNPIRPHIPLRSI